MERKSNGILKSCVSKMILVALLLVLGVDRQSVRSQGTVIGPNDDEDDSWYEAYLDLVVDWEEAEIRDLRLPYPSDKQVEMRTQARRDNLTTLVIEDLTEYEQLFYDYASTDGIKMLELLSNISLSMQDITIVNILTTGRIIRFTELVKGSNYFRDNLGQIGLFFHAIQILNFKVRMIPEYYPFIEG